MTGAFSRLKVVIPLRRNVAQKRADLLHQLRRTWSA